MANTFTTLCDLADFSSLSTSAKAPKIAQPATPTTPSADMATTFAVPQNDPKSQLAPSLHIDIQIHISPDSSVEQIDQIFRSMAKHLYRQDLDEQ